MINHCLPKTVPTHIDLYLVQAQHEHYTFNACLNLVAASKINSSCCTSDILFYHTTFKISMSVLRGVMDAVKSVATLMAHSTAVAMLAMGWTLMD